MNRLKIKINIIFCLTLFLFSFNTFCQKAIVFSSSIGYYNYRQTANALSVYHKLKKYGFNDQDIILMIPENSGCC
jgi:glycosylphosphatidylinositol transamidase (GPIT) subunit GPI8